MRYKRFILIFVLFPLIFQSCVSKKKFLEMQDGRLKAEEQVRNLTKENNAKADRIKALIADYEDMKNELLGSNALKDQHIDSLRGEIFMLRELLQEQKESLQESSFAFGFEQQRMKETLQSKDEKIQDLELQIESLDAEISEQASVIDDKNFRINRLNEEILTLKTEKERFGEQKNELEEQLQQVRSEVETLQTEMEEKDATITRLRNNVKLLKDELGEN
jgi:chromosome segregation ATPase